MAKHGAGAVGASGVVLVIAGGFLAYAVETTRTRDASDPTIDAVAIFSSSDGIEAGAPVQLAGLGVGSVTSVELDRRNYVADVHMRIDRRLAIPVDSQFAIVGTSMSGSAIEITPGHATKRLGEGARITATRPGQSLEQEVGNYIFGNGGLGDQN